MAPNVEYPRIIAPPPGPKAREILERDQQWTSTCYIKEYPLVVARGRGAMVEDVDGNRYLDFMAGIAVAATGHAHPAVVTAIKAAAERFLHICGSDFYYESMAALCERRRRGWWGLQTGRLDTTPASSDRRPATLACRRARRG